MWANLEHIVTNGPQVRHSTQATHYPTNTQCVGNRLAQAIGFWDFKVNDRTGFITTDLEANDNKVSVVERCALIRKYGNLRGHV